MKKIIAVFLIVFFLLPLSGYSKKADDNISIDVYRFFDSLMELASYGRKRDFYDGYIDKRELDYKEFVKLIDESETKLEGAFKSELISWEKKGRDIEVFLKLFFKSPRNPQSYEKKVKVILKRKKDGVVISKKELMKIFQSKRSK